RAGAELDRLITQLEPEWLQTALGYEFATLFAESLTAAPPAERWLKLRDGSSYRDAAGMLRYWPGFKNDAYESPIADYIYCRYSEQQLSITTEKGERLEVDNGMANLSAFYKQVRAWNRMVAKTGYQDRCGAWQEGLLYGYLLHARDEAEQPQYP